MSYSQLTSEQRYYISQLIGKQSISQIAKDIGCHKSTVSREIRRNSINQNYHFKQAQQLCQSRKCSIRDKFTAKSEHITPKGQIYCSKIIL